MTLDEIYTPLEEAKEEIKRRWEDKELQKKVEIFLNGDIPNFLQDSPKAFLARHIASPNFEFLLFEELTNKAGLDFVIPEFINDKFVPENTSKYHLGKMFFEGKVGKNGSKEIITDLVLDFNKANGKPICELQALNGKSVVDFHHGLFEFFKMNVGHKIHDFSGWLKKYDNNPEKFYKYFLAFFIRNGILFENFLLNKEEEKFTLQHVLPNIKLLMNEFGLKPLIVRLLPKEQEEDIHWYCYSKDLKNNI